MLDRRATALLGACAAIVAAVALALVLTSGETPPATGAAQVVPGDALLYVHLSTDPGRSAVKRAVSLARRFPDYPLLVSAVQSRLGAALNGPGDQVRSWLGNEAAFALLNTPTSTAGSLIVLDVARPRLARQFVLQAGAVGDGSYLGTPLLRNPAGTELAFIRHYLVLGQAASVRGAIDVTRGRVPSLAGAPTYEHATSDSPSDRVLDAYASVSGIRRVLGSRNGVLGTLGVLLDQPALTGVAVSLSATAPGARVMVHGALDATLAAVSGPVPPQFGPTLPDVLPAPGVLLLDVNDLVRWAPRILGASARAGVAGGVGPLFRRLGAALASEGVDVHGLSALFSGESAVAISPTTVQRSRAGGRSPRGPALVVVTRTKNQEATTTMLASLEGPLTQLFPPPASGPGQAPEFSEVTVGGVTVHQLHLAPGFELDYAVFRGLVVVATSLAAITEVIRPPESVDSEPRYQATLGDRPDQVTSLLFLDFSELLSLGQQTGLVGGGRVTALLPDLEKIRSVGLASTRRESDTNAELLFQIP